MTINKYDSILPYLQNNHFYPKKIMESGVWETNGLVLQCSPLMIEDVIVRVKELLKDDWSVLNMGSNAGVGEILLKLK